MLSRNRVSVGEFVVGEHIIIFINKKKLVKLIVKSL